jgi:hypothetical protein
MKRYLVFMLVFYLSVVSYGQIVNYVYDDSGNRTSRTVTLSKSLKTENDSLKSQDKITEQIEEQVITIYPNPFQEEVNIDITGMEENSVANITMYDHGGRLLLKRSNVSTRTNLNLSQYAKGVYFMIIRLGNNTTKWTIIKD